MSRMPRFHHLWIVEAELAILNPGADHDRRCERMYEALSRYATEETAPYPSQIASTDDGWLELTFPVWAPTQWAAVAAGATVLSEACARADVDSGVVRMAAGESSKQLERYRGRVREMETAT
jgi:hypothetical protein